MKVFCVIPAFNEAKNITTVVREIKPLVDKVIVIDDGSTDETSSLAEGAGAVVLRHLINRGQGAGLRTGTEYALAKGADIVVHFDADGQFLGQDIAKITEPIKTGEAEVVFGSRFLTIDNNHSIPFIKRYFIMPFARVINKLFFKIDLTDPQSGFRAMSNSVAGKINWQQDRMAHCSEIMAAVKKNNFRVVEVPIKVIYHTFGQSFFGGWKILKELFIAMIIN